MIKNQRNELQGKRIVEYHVVNSINNQELRTGTNNGGQVKLNVEVLTFIIVPRKNL